MSFLPVFFQFFPGFDISVGGTFYVGWLIVMAAGSLMHGRCEGIVIPSYVSSPDVLLTAIDFYSPPPLFFPFFPGDFLLPFLLFHLSKKGKLARRGDVEKLNFQWVPPFFALSPSFTLSVSIVLSFRLFPFMHALQCAFLHLDTQEHHLPNVASYYKCQESEFHFSNSILINPFKSHWGWWGHPFYLFIFGWFYLGRLRGVLLDMLDCACKYKHFIIDCSEAWGGSVCCDRVRSVRV